MPINSNVSGSTPSRERLAKQITLISGGYVDKEKFPNGGEITVYPWSPEVDEWIVDQMKSARKRKNLTWSIFPRLCDLNGLDPDLFLVGDANTVMLVSKSLSRDGVVDFNAQCPECGHVNTGKLKVPDQLEVIGQKDPETYVGYDEITMPESKDIVHVKPLTIADIKWIADNDDKYPPGSIRVVMSVDAVGTDAETMGKPDNPEELIEWWRRLHPRDQAFLDDQQSKLYPHLSTSIDYECDGKDCDNKFPFTLNFDDDFFRSSRLG